MKQPQKQQPSDRQDSSEREGGELLFEIGTEELPYQVLPPAITNVREAAERLFKEHRLTHGTVRTFGSPRRLTLVVESLASRQASMVKEVMGPSKAVAFDGTGVTTKAAVGFAASQGVKADELEVRQTSKGEYVFAVKRDPGLATSQILSELLPALVASLTFPKSMRWNAGGIKFPRPIRWLLALYGGQTMDVKFGGIAAGNRTWGHRFLGSTVSNKQGLSVKGFKSYANILEEHGVVQDQEKRRTIIMTQLDELSTSAHGCLLPDEGLLNQAVYTVECPHAILGTFDRQYLSVPKEVLMTAMKEHQGFFSLTDTDGALLPLFISVTNMKLSDMQLIREGNERVLAARLADAKFFFDEDRKTRLADRVERLKGVTFHQKLGTVYQKTERMIKLTDKLAQGVTDSEICRRAAQLSKTDLVTGIVGEFPTLQGIMGGEYARYDGEHPGVSRAIAEQYLPRTMESDLPQTVHGAIVSLADRLDTIAAFFHVDVVPTGSEDPFGLRRHALAIVRLIIEYPFSLDLSDVLRYACELVQEQGFKKSGAADPIEFLADRLRYYGRTASGLRDDVMDAVLKPAIGADKASLDFADQFLKMQALQAITAQPEFDPLMVGFKRAHRIVEKERWSREIIDHTLFQDSSEETLHRRLVDLQAHVAAAMERKQYAGAVAHLVQLKPAIDGFFNGVLVNAEDEKLRANRLSLLYSVDRLFLSFADFSQIQVQGA